MSETAEQQARDLVADLDAREARGERLLSEEEYVRSKLHAMLDCTPAPTAQGESTGGEV